MAPASSPGSNDPSKPAESVAGVDRFAHFVVNRREDGELDRLGIGGMGVTYRAFDTQLERTVALKVIHPQCLDDFEVRRRFAREARAAARLQHPNIASVLYQGEENSVCFYAMELVAGEDLHGYIHRVGPLGPIHALRMAQQIAFALMAASQEGVVHRDLKPANVMLTSYHDGAPHLKVIDFGLAKISAEVSSTIVTGGFLGTPEFASPEQCEEKAVDGRSDLYSLGGILWYLLTGAPPFSGSMLSVMKAQVSMEPSWDVLAHAPEPLLVVLRRLLAKDPEERPATANEASREIEDAIQELLKDRKNFDPLVEPPEGPKPKESGNKVAAPGGSAEKKRSVEKRKAAPAPGVPLPWVIAGLAVLAVPASWIFWQHGRVSTTGQQSGEQVTVEGKRKAGVFPERDAEEFTNSLGMKFIRLRDVDAFVSAWETRVGDYEHFASQDPELSKVTAGQPSWRSPGFPQTSDHPVVFVSAVEATAFCRWLSEKEHKAGILSRQWEYRLPERPAWDQAATGRRPPGGPQGGGPGQRPRAEGPEFGPNGDGPPPGQGAGAVGGAGAERPPLPNEEFSRGPGGRNGEMPPNGGPPYYWDSKQWPPAPKFGNFGAGAYGTENAAPDAGDGFAYTAPVGSFKPNARGFFDIAGNVAEICMDGPREEGMYLKQGGSWGSTSQQELTMHQVTVIKETDRDAYTGFRCELVPVE